MKTTTLATMIAVIIALSGCGAQGQLGEASSSIATVKSEGQTPTVLYVANLSTTPHGNGNVTVYDPRNGKLIRTINSGIGEDPGSLVVDTNGNLYVANLTENNVAVFAPGSSAPVRTITQGVKKPFVLAFDSIGNLYVGGSKGVTVYSSGDNSLVDTITDSVSNPAALTFDKDGALYVANTRGRNSYVTVYSANDYTLLRKLSAGLSFTRPWKVGMLFDRLGDLYVTNSGSSTVTVYHKGKRLVQTISQGVSFPYCLAFDRAGDLYVGNVGENSSSVTMYPPKSTVPSHTISQGVKFPVALLLDRADKLYSDNIAGSTVTVYSAVGKALVRTIDDGMNKPNSIAFGLQD
jgi:DNA-binding beta-propeller fold protein YncE